MKPLNFALIKLTLYFLLGVILGFYVQIPFRLLLVGLGICFVVFVAVFFISRKQISQQIFFGISTFVMVFLIGVFVAKFHYPKNQPNHYIHVVSSESPAIENPNLIIGKVVKILNPNPYANKYILEMDQFDGRTVEGKIMLNIKKGETGESPLDIDDKVALKSELLPINTPKNPHQFNYSTFMKNRGVFRQVYVSPEEILVFENNPNSYLGYAENIRNSIVISLKSNGFSDRQLGMVQALLLGQTQDITDETYDDYAAAGVIHILSVSGLHVGFVLLILNFILKPLERFGFGKPIKVILLIVLLWGFALLAGFSSPVVRSVTMFSFVAIGLTWERKTNILNILFMSLFAILLFAPRFIFVIGFQLSYLAVFSIVVFQPVFYKLYHPRFLLDKAFWGTLTVTMAAQIAVVPLSLYYFHQFPGLFFLSNLLVVPYVGIILGFGIFVVLLAFLNLLPAFIAELFGNCIDLLNWFVAWCADQRAFLFQNIHFSAVEMLTSYLLVFCLALLVLNFGYKKLVACCISAMILLGAFIYEKNKIARSDKFLVFQKNRKTMLGFKDGNRLALFHNLSTKNIAQEYSIRNFMIGEAIREISEDRLKNVYVIKDKFLLIVDSVGVYKLPEFQNGLILMRNSPKINLDRLIDLLRPKIIIADGSNYHTYVDFWRKTCKKNNIPFHYTGKKGAFVLKY